MKKERCVSERFCCFLVIGIMATVFFLSSQSGGESNHLSQGVLEHILGFFQIHVDPMKLDQYNLVLHKIAHFSLYFYCCRGNGIFLTTAQEKKILLYALPCVLCVLCSHRRGIISSCWVHVTEMLLDVLLDSMGAMVGVGVRLVLGKEFANKLNCNIFCVDMECCREESCGSKRKA